MLRCEIYRDSCIPVLRRLPSNSVHAIITDSPYGLGTQPPIVDVLEAWMAGKPYKAKGRGFMGNEWDAFVPGPEVWRECYRVLKPGGYLLSFFGTRTMDIGTLAIRIAGFEIRETIAWVYGQGMPKGGDLGKAFDKRAGVNRKVVGYRRMHSTYYATSGDGTSQEQFRVQDVPITSGPVTDAAKRWDGWAHMLRPSFEPIVMARKPFDGTLLDNVERHCVGALNVDACRLPDDPELAKNWNRDQSQSAKDGGPSMGGRFDTIRLDSYAPAGRWPSNLCYEAGCEEFIALLPETKDGVAVRRNSGGKNFGSDAEKPPMDDMGYGGGGSTSRFFKACEPDGPGSAARFYYCAKTNKSDKNSGSRFAEVDSDHPTVKPVDLMRWLVRMVTPPDGVVLDPFMGSGSTGVACKAEGFHFIGIERERDYFEIASKRLNAKAVSTSEDRDSRRRQAGRLAARLRARARA